MQNRAVLGRIYALFTGRSRSLRDLTTEISKRKVRSQRDAGSQTVPIKRIKGSEGRLGDFDCDFNPMQTRTFARWMSVAVARHSGKILPLVELIQLGGDYFVRDGHHRISVARALGEEYVDANIIVLELAPVSNALPTFTVTKGLDRRQWQTVP